MRRPKTAVLQWDRWCKGLDAGRVGPSEDIGCGAPTKPGCNGKSTIVNGKPPRAS